jgi:hypothetical protein
MACRQPCSRPGRLCNVPSGVGAQAQVPHVEGAPEPEHCCVCGDVITSDVITDDTSVSGEV